ncbi:hypothetical protein ACP4OV_005346 [Aristida adscensionis]
MDRASLMYGSSRWTQVFREGVNEFLAAAEAYAARRNETAALFGCTWINFSPKESYHFGY